MEISMIDTNYKMNMDTPGNKDPDTFSRTLCDYHLLLWSKPLPSGKLFNLTAKPPPPYYLYHNSDIGEFCFTSDSIIHTYLKWKSIPIAGIINAVAKSEIDSFYDLAHTIGGYIIFPANRIERQPTINAIRGMHPLIKDRFDLTLECIRRWYNGIESPLFKHLDRYNNFFWLFDDFIGYCKYFFLDDLVNTDSGDIRFWLPFTDFGETAPLPVDDSEYREYMKNVTEFTRARNLRIDNWCSNHEIVEL